MSEPAITLQAAHDDGAGNFPITRVVIHATCPPNVPFPDASEAGKARSTAVYFTESSSGGSAHYVEDVDSEEHCVAESHIAWHAPPNPHSLGIEIAGQADYTRAQWLDPAVWPAVVRAAHRTADLCQRYGVPSVKIDAPALLAGAHGICGHVDVTNAWHESVHTDPGPNFPWQEFMAVVTGTSPAASQVPHPGTVGVPSGASLPTLTYGMRNNQSVAHLQAFMRRVFPAYAADLPATGNYLDMTAAVMLEFQHRSNVTNADGSPPDGRTVGARTNAALWDDGYHG